MLHCGSVQSIPGTVCLKGFLILGVAGTLESGDIMVEIRPSDKSGVNVELESTVMNLFGKQIREVILETAKDCGLEDVEIIAHDKGALDCTIRSRVTTAALRATGSKYNW